MPTGDQQAAVHSRERMSPRLIAVLVAGGLTATTNAQLFALLLSPIADDLAVSVAQLGAPCASS